MQENESSDEEEVEPKLKYVRISNDLKRILNKDAVSSIAVHSKVNGEKFKSTLNRQLLSCFLLRVVHLHRNALGSCAFVGSSRKYGR